VPAGLSWLAIPVSTTPCGIRTARGELVVTIDHDLQNLPLGVFGEYLARMHFRSMERPPYTPLQYTTLIESPITTDASPRNVGER